MFAGIGITNQRETTVVWDKITGEPLHNAIGKGVVCEIVCNLWKRHMTGQNEVLQQTKNSVYVHTIQYCSIHWLSLPISEFCDIAWYYFMNI